MLCSGKRASPRSSLQSAECSPTEVEEEPECGVCSMPARDGEEAVMCGSRVCHKACQGKKRYILGPGSEARLIKKHSGIDVRAA